MKQIPKIEKVMTPMPYTIGKTIPLSRAREMMRDHRIRHLPVQEAGKLIGLLTDRDVKLVSSFQTGPSEPKVEDAMTPDPYAVTPETPVDHVAAVMAEHKYGCVIVQQENGKVIGIFTATDALRLLSDNLREQYRQAG